MKPENKILKELTERQKEFCRAYIIDWNGRKAYQSVYKVKDNVADVNASKLLSLTKVKDYIELIQKDLEKVAGLSRLKVLNEFQKLAFSSIASMHDTWITRKQFEELTDSQKACISEISTEVKTIMIGGIPNTTEFIKIKLYDKVKALENINKMLGYNAAEKTESKISIQKLGKDLEEEYV